MYTVILDKHRSTWYWTVKNPEGGSFGSNHCGTLQATIWKALRGIPDGATYQCITNGKVNEPTVKGLV
jgi:hypothetical protein